MASRGDDKLIGEGHVIVAAIDFGTTYSGFAYCKHSDYRNNPANPSIYCHTWNDGASHIREKAPTCVLFKPDGTFHSFGFDAVNYFYDNAEKTDFTQWYYFEHFKMMLFSEKDQLTKNTYLEESVMIGNKARRKKMKAMDVFAAVIGHFRDLLLNKRANETDSTDECIQWVITVPAIWDLKARTFMRDAAEKVGIPNNQLTLALEPEVASIHCRRVPVSVQTLNDGKKIIAAMTLGSKYIVLDQGGGTTDIAVHEVTGVDTLKEIHQACGGHWGGFTVNEAFYRFLIDVFGENVVDKIKQEKPSAYYKLLHNFEDMKKCFDEEKLKDPERKSKVIIPVEWIEYFENSNTVNLKESVKKSNFKGRVTIQNDKLKIKNSLLRTFFDYAIESIIAELNKLAQKEELWDVKTLLVVGGHAESPVLINALYENFPNLDIVVPKQPSLAILRGAVLYGFEPETITSRVMQYTYGIAMQRPFIPGVDPDSKKKSLVNGLVDNVFDKHTERGQTVNAGEFLKEHEYVPVRQDQVAVHFEFYATQHKNPKYVTDEGCSCIGILYFKLSGGMKSNKAMNLKINPSGTQIIAVVTEKDTGKESEGFFCLLD
ncbi:heat shock 70 kDa protein 12A-like [Mytilus californianus]|uniref:heat shock 70 kDa protein 12A-like n=1 Tax=Mytilus californianus TaxID=6549 RepID=UPI002247BF1D|nr:heat shock 70 kDa protein 12A-like [Mytilus californianus]